MSDVIQVEQLGHVRTITLSRPERRNALSAELLDALNSEILVAVDDHETRAILLRGAGKGFCAGFDLTPGKGYTGDGVPAPYDFWAERERHRRQMTVFETIWNCPLPVIASIHGFCLAGGSDLALHCDLVVTADDAVIGFPPVRNLGVPPAHMWVYRLGVQEAKYRMLTGDTFTGTEAVANGFAWASYAPDQVHAEGLKLAQRVALAGRELLACNKHVVNGAVDVMGRSVLQRIAVTEDAIAHMAPAAQEFRRSLREDGPAAAFRRRDLPYEAGSSS